MSLCLLVSGCCISLCVCVCVHVCVPHRWQREGRESWRGWWRELSEAPAALMSLRQDGLSVGICTGSPPQSLPTSCPPSPWPPHHPALWLGNSPPCRAVPERWFPLTSDVSLPCQASPFAPADDYFWLMIGVSYTTLWLQWENFEDGPMSRVCNVPCEIALFFMLLAYWSFTSPNIIFNIMAPR